MLHAFQPDQATSELLDQLRLSVNDEDFQAGVMVEVRMTGRDYKIVIGVLQFGQLFGDAVGMMVVDERDGADHGHIRNCRPLSD